MGANFLVLCNVLAFFVANGVSYAGNAVIVFERGSHGGWAEFVYFTLINLATAVPGLVLVWWFTFSGHSLLFVQVLFVVVSAVVNFVARKYLVFLR